MEILKRFQKIVADAEASKSARDKKQIIVSEEEPTYTTPVETFRALDSSNLIDASVPDCAPKSPDCANDSKATSTFGSACTMRSLLFYLLLVIPLSVVALMALFNLLSVFR